MTKIDSRSISNLKSVAALDATEREVFERIDTLPGNTSDGRLSRREIDAIDQPDMAQSLFPEERPAIARARALLDLGSIEATPAVPVVPLGSLIFDRTPWPQVAIASLPHALQRQAQRVQLTLNRDFDPTTISLMDLDLATRAGVFTARDQTDFAAIRALIAQQTPPGMQKVVEVPKLGAHVSTLAAHDELLVCLVSDTSLRASVRLDPNYKKVSEVILLRRQNTLQIVVPEGARAIVLSLDGKAERLLGSGTNIIDGVPESGLHRIEVWKDGKKVDQLDVDIPEFKTHEAEPLEEGTTFVSNDEGTIVELARHRSYQTMFVEGLYSEFKYEPKA